MTVRLDQQGLIEIEPADLEAVGRTGHVEPPDPVGHLVGQTDSFLVAGFQAPHPVAQGHGVVLPLALEIAGLQTNGLGGAQSGGNGQQFAVGEDVPVDEGGAGGVGMTQAAGDALIEKDSARTQQTPGTDEIFLQP